MDVKKERSSTSTKKWGGKQIVEFVGQVKQELKKVDWTSKDELKAYTKMVLASTFVMGFLVYFTDLIIQGCLNGINFIVRAIFG